MKILKIASLVLIAMIMFALPVMAIANPDSITIPNYKVFYDCLEIGDFFVAAEVHINYAVEPTDYDADEAFIFELLNASGNVTLASVPMVAYGDRPIGFYLSAAEKTALGLVNGTAYKIRVSGNPLIFASPVGNSANVTLSVSDYIDQDFGDDGGIPSSNNVRNFLITVAYNMQETDSPTDDYYTVIDGFRYVTVSGSQYFLEGISGIQNLCPILFTTVKTKLTADTPTGTGGYSANVTPLLQLGNTTSRGLTEIGLWLGFSQAIAGIMVLLIMVMLVMGTVYSRYQNRTAAMAVGMVIITFGVFLGLLELAVLYIGVAIIVILTGVYFWIRSWG